MANILVFGTSTTYGAWDSEGGWVQRLRKFIDQKIIDSNFQLDYLVYNLGISGDKSKDILDRFESETVPRLDKYGGENIFLFHLGINDCIFSETLGKTEVSEENFRSTLSELLAKASKYSSKVVIIGAMPVDDRVNPMPWSPKRAYRNEFVERFNQIMEEVAEKEGAHFVEAYKKFIETDYSSLLADGVHMNDEGYRRLFELVKDYLLEHKIININSISPKN